MNIFQFLKAWFCFAWLPLYFSSSRAQTASTTNNIDQRLQTEEGAVAVSASGGSNVTLQTLDGGAINAAFGLGEHAIDKVTTMATASQSASVRTAEAALAGAFHSIQGTKSAMDSATKEVAKAYEDAKVGSRSVMTMAFVALGGVLAVMLVMKK